MKKFLVSIVATLLSSIILWGCLYGIANKTNWLDKLKDKISISKEDNTDLDLSKFNIEKISSSEKVVFIEDESGFVLSAEIGTIITNYEGYLNIAELDNYNNIHLSNNHIQESTRYKVTNEDGFAEFVIEKDSISVENVEVEVVCSEDIGDLYGMENIEIELSYSIIDNTYLFRFYIASAN